MRVPRMVTLERASESGPSIGEDGVMASKATTTQAEGLRTQTCCHCGNAILWLATRGGRVIPVDAKSDSTGTVMIRRQDGKAVVLMGEEIDLAREALEPLYAYHGGTRCVRMKKRYTR